MTRLLEQAFSEASKLDAPQQDALARWLLDELESDRRWDELLAESGRTLSDLAEEARQEHRRGETKPLDPDRL